MSTKGRANTICARGRRALERRLGVDTRSLAVFRVGLASVLILDLLLRTRNLRTFYADDGVLPVSLLADQLPTLARISLHARSGEAWFQGLLFAVALAAAFAFLIGYRTRVATGISFCLLISLHARNPYVLSGADALLEHLLFWSLFLPLGERWSVDARRRETTRERVASVGSVAILSQVLLVYGVNAVLKTRSDPWMAGEAVTVILGLDRFTVFLGPLLRDLPTVLWLANWTWVGLLLASPLLVLATGRRRTALVVAFAGMHFGMLLTMYLGLFPLVSIVALIPFLPGEVWDAPDRVRTTRRLRSGLAGPLTFLSGVLPARPLDSSPLVDKQWREQCQGAISRTIAVLVLAGLVVFNAIALGFVPAPALPGDAPSVEDANPRWTMFAPHPPAVDRWYVAPGELASGERVDAYRGTELQWERPDDVTGTHSSPRMRKYVSNLRQYEQLRPSFADHLCDRWNFVHDGELTTVSMYVVEAPSSAVGGDSRERTKLVRAACDGGRGSDDYVARADEFKIGGDLHPPVVDPSR